MKTIIEHDINVALRNSAADANGVGYEWCEYYHVEPGETVLELAQRLLARNTQSASIELKLILQQPEKDE